MSGRNRPTSYLGHSGKINKNFSVGQSSSGSYGKKSQGHSQGFIQRGGWRQQHQQGRSGQRGQYVGGRAQTMSVKGCYGGSQRAYQKSIASVPSVACAEFGT